MPRKPNSAPDHRPPPPTTQPRRSKRLSGLKQENTVPEMPPEPPPPVVGPSSASPTPILVEEGDTKPHTNLEPLSILLPPPKPRDPSEQIPPNLLELISGVKRHLVSLLTSPNNMHSNAMVEAANKAFTTLDWFQAEFKDFHEAVRVFILYHCELEKLNTKYGSVLRVKTRKEKLKVELQETSQELSDAGTDHFLAARRLKKQSTQMVDLRKQLIELEETLPQLEAEVIALEAQKNQHEAKRERLCQKLRVLDVIEGSWVATQAGIARSRDGMDLSLLATSVALEFFE